MKPDQNDVQGERRKTISKKNFEEPKLKFIQPTLKKHGDVTKITAFNGGGFGTFSPNTPINGTYNS